MALGRFSVLIHEIPGARHSTFCKGKPGSQVHLAVLWGLAHHFIVQWGKHPWLRRYSLRNVVCL